MLLLNIIITLQIAAFLLKIVSLICDPTFDHKLRFFLFSPMLATRSWNLNQKTTFKNGTSVLGRFFLVFIATFIMFHLTRKILLWAEVHYWIAVYITIPYFYLTCELLSSSMQLISIPLNQIPHGMLRNPLMSKSLSEFWGYRWNMWINEWFKQVMYERMKYSRNIKAVIIFVFSGLLHEACIALPVYYVTKINIFGWWTLFFMFQLIGITIDKKLLVDKPIIRRVFMFLVVMGPIPLLFTHRLIYQSFGIFNL